MSILPRQVELSFDVPIQCPHHAYPGEHRWALGARGRTRRCLHLSNEDILKMELFQHLILGALLGAMGAGIKFSVYLKSASDQLDAEQLRAGRSLPQRLVLKYLWPDLPVALVSGSGAALLDHALGGPTSLLVASILAGYAGFDAFEVGKDFVEHLGGFAERQPLTKNMNGCTMLLSDRHIASLTRIARDHGVTRGEVVRRAIDAYAVEN
jgi:hypothetical protein